MIFSDEAFARFQSLGRYVAQHFELIGTLADEGAQRDGDRQAGHASSGDAHAHGVLQNIGAQQGFNLLGPAAQLFGGPCRAKGHGHGLGAADGGDNFFMDQCNNAFTCGFVDHAISF